MDLLGDQNQLKKKPKMLHQSTKTFSNNFDMHFKKINAENLLKLTAQKSDLISLKTCIKMERHFSKDSYSK